MPWTSYHDGLVKEMESLAHWMSNPSATVDQVTGATRYNKIRDELLAASAGDPSVASKTQDLLAQFEQARVDGTAANENRYQELKTGYAGRTKQINDDYLKPTATKYGDLISSDATRSQSMLTGLNDRITSLNSMFTGLGNQAKQDVSNVYSQNRAKVDQSLTSRGLGNTTVRQSAMSGLAGQEAQDLSRVNEGLRTQQIGLNTQLTGDYQQALERSNVRQNDLAAQSAGFGERAAGMMSELTKEPLGVVERRTDTVPSLADIANLSLNLGRGQANTFALNPMAPQSVYQQSLAGLFGGK